MCIYIYIYTHTSTTTTTTTTKYNNNNNNNSNRSADPPEEASLLRPWKGTLGPGQELFAPARAI